MRYTPIFLLALFLALVPAAACGQTVDAAAYLPVAPSGTAVGTVPGVPPTLDIASGIPPVSTQEFVARLSGLAGRIYNLIGLLAPYLLLVLFALAAVGFVFKALWKMLVFAVLGYVLLQFAPMLIGLMEHYLAH